LSKRSQLWLALVAALMGVAVLAALLLPRSFWLTALSDIIQSLLLASGTAAFVPLALRTHGRIRLFWSLVALGTMFWLAYQLFWTYSEVLLRRDVPDLCAWDVVLFLHVVPLMAAVSLRPRFLAMNTQLEWAGSISRSFWCGGFICTSCSSCHGSTWCRTSLPIIAI